MTDDWRGVIRYGCGHEGWAPFPEVDADCAQCLPCRRARAAGGRGGARVSAARLEALRRQVADGRRLDAEWSFAVVFDLDDARFEIAALRLHLATAQHLAGQATDWLRAHPPLLPDGRRCDACGVDGGAQRPAAATGDTPGPHLDLHDPASHAPDCAWAALARAGLPGTPPPD